MMICAACGSEYRDGFHVCVDCGGTLIVAPPEEELARRAAAARHHGPNADLVPVFESGNAALVPLAKSILESAGIGFSTRGESLRDGLAWVPFPDGFSTAPVVFFVRQEDAADATTLLADLKSVPAPRLVACDSGDTGDADDADDEEEDR